MSSPPQEPTEGMDFWSVIEFDGEPRKKGSLGTENDKRVAGRLREPAAGERAPRTALTSVRPAPLPPGAAEQPVPAPRVTEARRPTGHVPPKQNGPEPIPPPKPPRTAPPPPKRPRAEPRRAEAPPAEPLQAAPPTVEPPQAKAPSAEPPRAEAPQVEPPQTKAASAEPPRTEPPQVEQPQAKQPQAKAASAEPPRTEAPPVEPPQAEPSTVESPPVETPLVETPSDEPSAAEPAGAVPAPDEDWTTAARIAASIRPSIGSMWLDMLSRHTGGDPAMARKVYYVMGGLHLIGELWQDPRVMEVHVRGTRVTVFGEHGVHEVAGFPSEAAARRAVECAEAAQDRMDARVTRAGESVVVSRRTMRGPTIARLLDTGVVTRELLSQVEGALARLETVTVTGPAARVVIRALAQLIPPGSRVFEGPHAVLPPGCVAAAEPLDADYVIGVRPGATAERMASAGQVGALIANPESEIRAAVRLVVSGRSAAPELVMRALTRVMAH